MNKKKFTIFKKSLRDINKQLIGGNRKKVNFFLAYGSHYLFKAAGLKSILKFPEANFRYQNIILNARKGTIDFWPCLESYEPDVTYMLTNVIGNEKGTFVDIGANIGRYTTLMAKQGWDVLAFEPIPSNIQSLEKNLQINQCQENAKIFNVALGNQDMKQEIFFNNMEFGGASLIKMKEHNNTISIDVRRYDSLMEDYNYRDLVFAKIDVEGHEEKVMNSMVEFLTKEKPLLMIELWSAHSPNLVSILRELGYKRLHVFWFVESKHQIYMDKMYNLYKGRYQYES